MGGIIAWCVRGVWSRGLAVGVGICILFAVSWVCLNLGLWIPLIPSVLVLVLTTLIVDMA